MDHWQDAIHPKNFHRIKTWRGFQSAVHAAPQMATPSHSVMQHFSKIKDLHPHHYD